ncbi:MAG: hypothetical protein LBC75_02670 [Fibromonadaceae bacterium]|jgi:uncharacterized protein (TIGR02145 family)|nr:hypothetical protein [Fibromonadaceae bacterium]
MRIAFDQLLRSEEPGDVQIQKEPEKTTWRFDLKGALDGFGERLDKIDGGETSGVIGQIGSMCVHGKKIKADMYLGRQGSWEENIGSPPSAVPFNVWKRVGDHWEEYSYTPKDNDLWQNLWDDTFWIWLFGKWIRFNTKNQWLPNTTTNTYSTGITEGASLAMEHNSKLAMSGGASLEMSGGASQEMLDGSRLEMSGSVEINIKGGSKLRLHESAEIDLGNSAKLHAKGAGAISGLQGAIRSEDAILYPYCRVYKIREDFDARSGLWDALDSFSQGDLFYFIAEKMLEGDAYVRYFDSDGYAAGAMVNQDVSAVLMLVEKVGEGENTELRFEKISDANLKANIFPTFNDEYNYTLAKEIGGTFEIGFRDLSTGKVIEGQTLIYDKFGTIGIIIGKRNTHGGPIYTYKVISTTSEFMNIPPFSFIRLKNDYELSDEVNETNQFLLESFEMPAGELPVANRTLVNDKNGTLGIVTRIDTLPWGDVMVTVVTISNSTGKFDGTNKQVVLGNGELTPEEGADGEVLNAASSLFSLGSRNNALRFVYGEFEDRGGYIDLNSFLKIIGDGLVNLGYFQPPPGEMLIASASLSIIPPVNGIEQNDEVAINDSEPNYTTGNVIWLPDDEIANGTKSYVAKFSIIADFDFKFDETTNVFVNGSRPTSVDYEEDGSLTITKNFAATMTANPSPEITIAMTAGGTKPSIATKIDSGYYTSSIVWTGSGNVFNYEPSTGTITLTASTGYRWNTKVVNVNGTNVTGTLSIDGTELILTKTWTPLSISTPNLTITEPAFGANRPSTATAVGNFANAISWTPSVSDDKYPAGDNTGTFQLTANTGHIFASNSLKINKVSVNGSRTSNNTVLTAQKIFNISNPNEGTVTDARDGKVYPWKVMPDGKKWMTVNLDYNQSGSVYYNNAANPPFADAGRLYTFAQAQAAVLPGWHLPSKAEWELLKVFVADVASNGNTTPTAGRKLKANHTWNAYNGVVLSTDDYGFSALASGMSGQQSINKFAGLNANGCFWSSSYRVDMGVMNHSYAYYLNLDYRSEDAVINDMSVAEKMSIRLVMD